MPRRDVQLVVFFFFKQKTAYEITYGDWSSDVCSFDLGLRTLVHAFRDSVRMATLAGCTQVEHGLGASDDDLKLMVERGTILDPQAGLVLENYIANKEHSLAPGTFTEETFAAMPALIPRLRDFVRHAAHTPG